MQGISPWCPGVKTRCLLYLVRLSIFPSVVPSVLCGQNRARSVSSTILNRSIPYLHILSNNFRKCVTCICLKIQIFDFGKFFICIWLCWCAILIVVMAKHFLCPFFRNTCGRTSRFSHPQCPCYQLCAKYLYPSTLLWQINCFNL